MHSRTHNTIIYHMKTKVREKEVAIMFRKKGLSYSDILAKIPVSKSSLSLWLKNLALTDEEKSSLKKRKNSNISRGRIRSGATLTRLRLKREKVVYGEAKSEFKKNVEDPFFHIGVALY